MMAQRSAGHWRLWRYNYSILAGNGYWILVLPIAASQVVTLWMMAMAAAFDQYHATRIAELMTPILGAFLTAHCLAPEYRSGVGAVLASKPISLYRVFAIRVGLAMTAAAGLTLVTLTICRFGLQPIRLGEPMLAALPSLFFLSILALTFATLFRSAIGGFAVAAAIWALDMALGYSVHPFLSVQGLSARMEGDLLSVVWLHGKALLLVAGVVLLWVHGRMIGRICRPPERGDIIRMVAVSAVVVVGYCGTGAAAMVGYAYLHRGELPQHDAVWLRRQLKIYGPVPVASFFGPAFAALVADPTDDESVRKARARHLEQALARWPRSIWAEHLAYSLAHEQEAIDPAGSTVTFFSVADRYGGSPFAPKALSRILRIDGEIAPAERLRAARRILAEYPGTREAESAAETLRDHYPADVRVDEMLKAAALAVQVCPRHRRPDWLLATAELQMDSGKTAEARAAAQQAMDEANALLTEAKPDSEAGKELLPHTARLHHAVVGARDLLSRL